MQTVSEVARGGLGDAFVPGRQPAWVEEGPPARIVSAEESLAHRIAAIWASRELLVFLVRKELKVRYQASVLGFLWSMLNPAIVLLTYYLVFKLFLRSPIPDFALMLFAGLLVWNLFSIGVQSASTAVVASAGIVKKVAFPREVLPLAQVGVAVFFFFLQLLVMVIFLAGFQIAPDWSGLPLVAFGFVDVVALTAGLALLLSGLTVKLRDLEHLTLVLMQAWFWLVPIVYPFATTIHDHFEHGGRWITDLFLADPVTPIILAFQRVFWGKLGWNPAAPGDNPLEIHYTYGTYGLMLAAVLVGSLLIFWLGMVVFGRVAGNFAEEL
jgi:ABC-2 type transport system permease protein